MAEPPPTTFCVFRETKERVGAGPGVTASVVLCVVPSVAVIVAVVAAVTELVVTGNVTLVAPAGTVTLAGTVTALELSERGTTSPPAGAVEFSTTVPVAAVPPVTLALVHPHRGERRLRTRGVDGELHGPAHAAAGGRDRHDGRRGDGARGDREPAARKPAVTVTVAGTEATAGLLLVNWNVWS